MSITGLASAFDKDADLNQELLGGKVNLNATE
jgi:hypothetical protein